MTVDFKEKARIFYMVKGHLNVTEKTICDCYNGYFSRLWGNHENCYHEDGFEEAYTKKFLARAQE